MKRERDTFLCLEPTGTDEVQKQAVPFKGPPIQKETTY